MKVAAKEAVAVAVAPGNSSGGATALTAAADDDDNDAATSTVFVKNLAFATTDEKLKKHFDKVQGAGRKNCT